METRSLCAKLEAALRATRKEGIYRDSRQPAMLTVWMVETTVVDRLNSTASRMHMRLSPAFSHS